MTDNVTYQVAQPATPPRATVIKTTLDGTAHVQHVNVDSAPTTAVTGPLTDTELRATAVPVSDGSSSLTVDGTVAATQSGVWSAKFVDESGTAYGVKHIENKPRVSSMPYLYDIAEGNVSGHEAWTKIGYTPTMNTTESDLWSKAGVYVFPATAQQMEVVSSDNTQDKAGGTGATAVTIYYLDNAWAEQTEVVLLDGTTPVNTVATNIYRINGFRVTAAGATGKSLGNLSLRNTAGDTTYGYITAGYTRARSSFYTVPANKTLYVTSFTVSFGYAANQTHYCRLYTRATQNAGVRVAGIFYPYTEVVCANTSQHVMLEIPTKLVEKVDIKVSGIASVAGIASIALRGWLE